MQSASPQKSREDRIAEFRMKQPRDVLEYKADLSRTKSKLWTQEQIDLIKVEAEEMYLRFCGPE